ncbi:S-adenosyl-L-methionine-dependent methyltransferase [Aspergillus heterothallicus]
MDAIFKQIKEEYAQADDTGKRQIQGHVRELQVGFYSDWDVVMRLSSGPLQVALARVGLDLGLFRMLKDSHAPLTLAHLVEKTGAAPGLLARILRFQAAFGLIKETGQEEYTASAMTAVFCNPNAAGAISHMFDVSGPCTLALPDFLAETGYAEPTSLKNCPFQRAFRTDQTLFEWLPQNPKHLSSLGQLMGMQRPMVWVDHFPVLEYLGDFAASPERPLLVDVGGSFGHQSKAFRAKFPNLRGRVIVQDMPQVIAQAPHTEGVEFAAHDFFSPQPVRGAKFYYLRHVLHDWADPHAIEILGQLVPALARDSVILIDDILIPARGAAWQATFVDLMMMGSLAGVERTKAQFDELVDKVGLKIVDVFSYDVNQGAILVAVPK